MTAIKVYIGPVYYSKYTSSNLENLFTGKQELNFQ